ncbi:putative quinol monooxygenase [Pseudomonas fontis]|uniref:Antibiotic biosynthesis monooxygenase n=1 Tax=Pseudomonas fontis TaxID=2942633 RepID=A0ABT5NP56_9PSED|nr:antibiotic biosynthesis monooxygenase family protein [Pseudomonas fontis]MDD0974424.1 antibiotic biosynthesis monooxygenase [Pseudomonas fontis]MDD0989966.1 antibiotic biosynthesis monooxygenase [Pseudomonas fontis]
MTSSKPVSHLSFVRASAGRSVELGERLQQLLEPCRQTPGCLHFSLQRSTCDADLWLLTGLWADQSALNDYFTSPSLQLFGELAQTRLMDSLDLQTFMAPSAG